MTALIAAPIGQPIEENSPGETSCSYPPGEAASYGQAEIGIEWDHGNAPSFERQLADVFGNSEAGSMVSHAVRLGDGAAYSSEGVLSIRSGKMLVTITLPMRPESEKRAIAIGKTLLERLGVPTAPAAASDAPATTPFPDGLSVGDECPVKPATPDTNQAESALIPLKVGLTLSSTWTTGGYDHECLLQVVSVNSVHVDLTYSCPMDSDHHNVTQSRRLCQSDLRDSYFYRTETAERKYVPDVSSPSTMFSLSSRSLRELKATGSTRHRYIQIDNDWRTSKQPLDRDIDITLLSERQGVEPYKIIVNDRMVALPTIVAVAAAGERNMTTARILDDVRFPIVLDYERPDTGFSHRYERISYPTGGEMEKLLAVGKHVDVYGIYFDFASDRLRPESTPVLAEIAEVLKGNADWKLTISGHTDNVGSDESNLDLSRRRAQSVKAALGERYAVDGNRLTTGGFGASQPQAKNDTPEGRARNRRVELTRQ
jgi:hypothetical protein